MQSKVFKKVEEQLLNTDSLQRRKSEFFLTSVDGDDGRALLIAPIIIISHILRLEVSNSDQRRVCVFVAI